MNQPTLFDFDTGEPSQHIPSTATGIRPAPGSGVANRNRVHRETRPTHTGVRAEVLRYITKMNTIGATRDEIAAALNLPISTVCGRVNELLDPRWPDVLETAERRTTRAGKSAVVVVAQSVLAPSPGSPTSPR